MLLLHETLRDDGSLARVHLAARDGGLALEDEAGLHPLPDGALHAVMRRYGKELEGALPEAAALGALPLEDGARLVRFRHKDGFDVIARDYVAYEAPGEVTLFELAVSVTAALTHLAKAYAERATS